VHCDERNTHHLAADGARGCQHGRENKQTVVENEPILGPEPPASIACVYVCVRVRVRVMCACVCVCGGGGGRAVHTP
jgi:hypothetical protein